MSETIYFNTAACGLVPLEIAAPGIAFLDGLAQNGAEKANVWRTETVEEIRENMADFIKADAKNIALIPSFSYGINAVVASLKGTEKLLLYELDYPSLNNPFKVNNFDISWLPAKAFQIDLQLLEEKIKSEDINILAISHVQWLSGFKINLKKVIDICRNNDVNIIVDGTQSLGAMPIYMEDLKPDVFIASHYKWMNGAFGSGVIYASDDFLKKYPPTMGGVNSYQIIDGKERRTPSILDFEPGHRNMAIFSIVNAAVKDKMMRGLSNIEQHNLKLTQQFIEAYPDLPVTLAGGEEMANRSAILVLKDENGLGEKLVTNNFAVTLRNQTIRLAFHYYNTEDEVKQLINFLSDL